jgi:N-acetylmuramoyl-L-alanine amidase
MSLLGDLLGKLGLHGGPAANVIRETVAGVHLRFTRDLHPLPDNGLTGGHLLELHAILDERFNNPSAAEKIRFDVLEEDVVVDDRVISLLGTGAAAPEAGAATRQLTTQIFALPDGETLASFTENFKRSFPTSFEDTLFVVTETPDPLAGHVATRRTHVLAWLRVEKSDIGDHAELYFALDIADVLHAASPVLEITAAPPGVSVRVTGSLTDAAPLGAPEPCAEIPVVLDSRRAATGEAGDFVIDARLATGDHPLTFSRPGIDPVTLTVGVTVAGDGKATAAIRDAQGAVLVTATTAAAATEQSVLTLDIPNPVAVAVHKLRGTVIWPDSLPGDVAADYRGSPLAERRVYVLPIPAGGSLAGLRPKTSREWEALKRRSDVLRSTRPGRPAQAERTDTSGRFEVRYVDFTAGNRFLIWVERLDPVETTDTTTESPDFIVRAFRRELIELTAAKLTTVGDAGFLASINRNLVDHEYTTLTGDCVPVALDALRVADFPADGLSLARPAQTSRVVPPYPPIGPSQASRALFETQEPLDARISDNLGIPASRTVGSMADPGAAIEDGLDLFALPLVPVFESPDAQGGAPRRATAALAQQGDTAFADYEDIPPLPALERLVGHDRAAVRLVVDAARLSTAIAQPAGPVVDPLATTPGALAVKLLESTFVVRPQLGEGATLAIEQARWHIDAMSLADYAFVAIDPGAPTVASRALTGTIHPVLAGVSPLLPALAPRRVYLAPGHGLAPKAGKQASNLRSDWSTNRGGYAENAGEDEIALLMAAELARILEACGARRGISTCRELYDFTLSGVSNPAGGRFDVVTDPDFPRLWQQNPVFYLGQRPVPADFNAVQGSDAPAGDRVGDGITVRAIHMTSLATRHQSVDLIFCQHSNATVKGAAPGLPAPAENTAERGIMVEYLDVFAAGGDVPPGQPMVALTGEGNQLGLGLATRLFTRMGERLNINRRRVARMGPAVNAEGVRDLFATYDHWALGPIEHLNTPRLDHRPNPVAGWNHQVFQVPGAAAPLRIPVALAEHAFHDNRDDARLLRRSWFRRLAAEGAALAIDAQLQSANDAPTNAAVREVLRRTFGVTAPLRALPVAGVATPASIGAALRAVGDAGAANPAAAEPWIVATQAMTAARALSRRQLVERISDAVRTTAGWQANDAPSTIDLWIGRALTAGLDLDRPDQPATRDDAGTLACNAVGLTPAGIATAERVGVGAPAAPLVRPAAVARGQSAYLGPVEADALVARLATLTPGDLYKVADAYLADGSWSRLDTPRGSTVYELDPATPLTVIFRTAGIPWKTVGQTATNRGIDDVEIRAVAGGRVVKLACMDRATRLVASATWFLDLPPGAGPTEVQLELWVRRRSAAQALRVGSKRVTISVRPLPSA